MHACESVHAQGPMIDYDPTTCIGGMPPPPPHDNPSHQTLAQMMMAALEEHNYHNCACSTDPVKQPVRVATFAIRPGHLGKSSASCYKWYEDITYESAARSSNMLCQPNEDMMGWGCVDMMATVAEPVKDNSPLTEDPRDAEALCFAGSDDDLGMCTEGLYTSFSGESEHVSRKEQGAYAQTPSEQGHCMHENYPDVFAGALDELVKGDFYSTLHCLSYGNTHVGTNWQSCDSVGDEECDGSGSDRNDHEHDNDSDWEDGMKRRKRQMRRAVREKNMVEKTAAESVSAMSCTGKDKCKQLNAPVAKTIRKGRRERHMFPKRLLVFLTEALLDRTLNPNDWLCAYAPDNMRYTKKFTDLMENTGLSPAQLRRYMHNNARKGKKMVADAKARDVASAPPSHGKVAKKNKKDSLKVKKDKIKPANVPEQKARTIPGQKAKKMMGRPPSKSYIPATALPRSAESAKNTEGMLACHEDVSSDV